MPTFLQLRSHLTLSLYLSLSLSVSASFLLVTARDPTEPLAVPHGTKLAPYREALGLSFFTLPTTLQ